MIIFILINLIFLALLFFEETIKMVGVKYFKKCCLFCMKLQTQIDKNVVVCEDYYLELKLPFLLDEFKRTSMELEKYKSNEKDNKYPDD